MMDVLYGIIDTLLPFEWTEFDFMKNALLAVLLISLHHSDFKRGLYPALSLIQWQI